MQHDEFVISDEVSVPTMNQNKLAVGLNRSQKFNSAVSVATKKVGNNHSIVEILPNCKSFPELSHGERMTAASLRGGNAVALVEACIAWHPAFAATILARAPP